MSTKHTSPYKDYPSRRSSEVSIVDGDLVQSPTTVRPQPSASVRINRGELASETNRTVHLTAQPRPGFVRNTSTYSTALDQYKEAYRQLLNPSVPSRQFITFDSLVSPDKPLFITSENSARNFRALEYKKLASTPRGPLAITGFSSAALIPDAPQPVLSQDLDDDSPGIGGTGPVSPLQSVRAISQPFQSARSETSGHSAKLNMVGLEIISISSPAASPRPKVGILDHGPRRSAREDALAGDRGPVSEKYPGLDHLFDLRDVPEYQRSERLEALPESSVVQKTVAKQGGERLEDSRPLLKRSVRPVGFTNYGQVVEAHKFQSELHAVPRSTRNSQDLPLPAVNHVGETLEDGSDREDLIQQAPSARRSHAVAETILTEAPASSRSVGLRSSHVYERLLDGSPSIGSSSSNRQDIPNAAQDSIRLRPDFNRSPSTIEGAQHEPTELIQLTNASGLNKSVGFSIPVPSASQERLIDGSVRLESRGADNTRLTRSDSDTRISLRPQLERGPSTSHEAHLEAVSAARQLTEAVQRHRRMTSAQYANTPSVEFDLLSSYPVGQDRYDEREESARLEAFRAKTLREHTQKKLSKTSPALTSLRESRDVRPAEPLNTSQRHDTFESHIRSNSDFEFELVERVSSRVAAELKSTFSDALRSPTLVKDEERAHVAEERARSDRSHELGQRRVREISPSPRLVGDETRSRDRENSMSSHGGSAYNRVNVYCGHHGRKSRRSRSKSRRRQDESESYSDSSPSSLSRDRRSSRRSQSREEPQPKSTTRRSFDLDVARTSNFRASPVASARGGRDQGIQVTEPEPLSLPSILPRVYRTAEEERFRRAKKDIIKEHVPEDDLHSAFASLVLDEEEHPQLPNPVLAALSSRRDSLREPFRPRVRDALRDPTLLIHASPPNSQSIPVLFEPEPAYSPLIATAEPSQISTAFQSAVEPPRVSRAVIFKLPVPAPAAVDEASEVLSPGQKPTSAVEFGATTRKLEKTGSKSKTPQLKQMVIDSIEVVTWQFRVTQDTLNFRVGFTDDRNSDFNIELDAEAQDVLTAIAFIETRGTRKLVVVLRKDGKKIAEKEFGGISAKLKLGNLKGAISIGDVLWETV